MGGTEDVGVGDTLPDPPGVLPDPFEPLVGVGVGVAFVTLLSPDPPDVLPDPFDPPEVSPEVFDPDVLDPEVLEPDV